MFGSKAKWSGTCEMGHERKRSLATSGLPSGTDVQRSAYDFGFVPEAEVTSLFNHFVGYRKHARWDHQTE